jgi:hypothetical protein
MARKIAALILAALSALFWYAYIVQYAIWRDCFNDLGRCHDPVEGVVYLEQSGAIWVSLALVTTGAALWLIWWPVRARRPSAR